MAAMSRKRDRQRRPARKVSTKSPKRRLLVVCEGLVTEPGYIKGYERHVRNNTVEVEIADEQGDPKRVVEIAKDRAGQASRDAKRHGDDFLMYDGVWCVFDRDDHERFSEACVMARDNGFGLAVSNPCFELWLLLHFRENPGAQHRHDIVRMLRSYVDCYDKHVDFSLFADYVDRATARGRKLGADAVEAGEEFRNPTTGVYRLAEAIAHSGEA